MDKTILIDKVIDQIKEDIFYEDLTAIVELLKKVDVIYLENFISEVQDDK